MKPMKRKLKLRFALPALTVLLVIAGGLMPYVVSRFQDAYILKNLGAMMFEPMTLTLQQEDVELTPLLRLLSEERFTRLEWSGETSLSITGVQQRVNEFLSQLKALELISFEDTVEYGEASPSADFAISPSPLRFAVSPVMDDRGADSVVMVSLSPFLYVSQDGSFSAVVWECSFFPENRSEYTVFLDDSSGKAIKMAARSPYLDFGMQESALIATLQAERWRSFCESYYEIDIPECKPVSSTEAGMRFRMTVKLSDSQEMAISLTIYENYTVLH